MVNYINHPHRQPQPQYFDLVEQNTANQAAKQAIVDMRTEAPGSTKNRSLTDGVTDPAMTYTEIS